jgi:hypothetical protein
MLSTGSELPVTFAGGCAQRLVAPLCLSPYDLERVRLTASKPLDFNYVRTMNSLTFHTSAATHLFELFTAPKLTHLHVLRIVCTANGTEGTEGIMSPSI